MGDCILWQGPRTTSRPGLVYGRTSVNGRRLYAHRVAYEQVHGPIPAGLVIDHLCRNTLCVRVSHLEAVPNRTNVLRGEGPFQAKARATECQRGHPFDAANTRVRKDGTRECRACHNARRARRPAQRPGT